MGLLPTTRLFAQIDAAVATVHPDVATEVRGRLLAAVPGDRRRPPTATRRPAPRPAWAPLVANPAYSDYTSGHAAATSPFAQVMRRTLGDDTPLVLKAGGVERTYTTLSALEHDALHARIWGGLHFRDAMEDGYKLGHPGANG